MAGSRGISGNFRPFPQVGNLKTIGEVSNYLNTLGNWVADAVDRIGKRAIQPYAHDALPPFDGLTRIIEIPDDPDFGDCLAVNVRGTAGTASGWYRVALNGTSGGGGETIPAGGTTSQVLGKKTGTDFDFEWQTPYYVPTNGTTSQVLRKTGTASTSYAWSDAHEVPSGGTTSQVLGKSGTADYAVAWQTPHYLTTGGTGGQILAKNGTNDYDASWTNSVGTLTSSELISSGQLTAGGTSSWGVFSSTAAYLGKPVQLANAVTAATVGAGGTASAMPAPLAYLHLTVNGTAVALALFNP